MADPDVDDLTPTTALLAQNWAFIDALAGGTDAIRKAGEKFLPKFPSEDPDGYKARLASATLFPAFARTANVLAAKPFSRQIDIQGTVPEAVKATFDNVDMQGTALQPFCAGIMQAVMKYGVLGVLVDVPHAEGLNTVADEKEAGVRPYLATYAAQNILGWRSEKSPEGEKLTLLRLLEFVEEPSGEWSTTIVKQVRVLRPGSWETWRKSSVNGVDRWVPHGSGVMTLEDIPFVFFYAIKRSFGVANPPLMELAHLNIEHYQSSSDQRTILHVARVPILFAKGFEDNDKIVVGASSACRSNSKDADLSYVEHTGAAIEAGRQSVLDLEDKMRQVGAELLVQQPANVTATATSQDSEGNRSTMQMIAESFERSTEACIVLMAEWLHLTATPVVKLFKDFGAGNMSEKSGQLLLNAAKDDHVSSETVFDSLKRLDVLPQELDWDTEKMRLAAQPRGAPPDRNKPPAAPSPPQV